MNPDEMIHVRGIPVSRVELAAFCIQKDAGLFDEVMFQNNIAKRLACANVIVHLDQQLARYRKIHRKLPETLDIGDRSWLYIPVPLSGPDAIVKTNKVAWFRTKRFHKV